MPIRNLDNQTAKKTWAEKASDLPKGLRVRARFLMEIMNATDTIKDLAAQGAPPELRPHKLKGKMKGRWAVDIDKVSGWRITFEFKEGQFIDVRIENYH